ncbi:MAG TPA: beta-galactosidase [Armatimonadota bacterium]|jgi:hypothetical protein
MTLALDNGRLLVQGNPLIYFSGEIHYWRVNPQAWREALIMAKLNGLNFISTYIPWDFHEIDEGYTDLGPPLSYDFTGRTDPRKNLIGFLELAQQEGLYVAVRPGPAILAEWRQKGPALHSFAFDWPDPRYRTALSRWYDAVCRVITRYQVDNGGPIALCQVDNESHELTVEGARWYFEQTYTTIEAFNARFGASFTDFASAAHAICQTAPHNVLQEYVTGFAPLHPHLAPEYRLAKNWFHERMIEEFTAMLRERGVNVPIYLNSNGSPDAFDFLGMQEHIDFMTLDIYPPNRVPLGYYPLVENMSKYTASTSRWPLAMEFPSSTITRAWYIKLGPIGADHIARCAMLEAASGVQGFNYFMFMDRDLASRSPLNENGKPSDAYFTTFHLHRALQRAGFPASKPMAKMALYCAPLRAAALHSTVPSLDWLELEHWHPHADPLDGYAGLYQALIQRDADFAVIDYRQDNLLRQFDIVLVPGLQEMALEEYQRLQSLGERVVWVGEPPTQTPDGSALPLPAGTVIHALDELNATVQHTIKLSHPGVRSYLHRLEDDWVIYLLNLDATERTVRIETPALAGDLVDCWTALILGPVAEQEITVSGFGWRLLRVSSHPERITGVSREEREYF